MSGGRSPGVFVCYSRPDPGVFESQVLEVGNLLKELGIDYRYVVFEGLRTALAAGRRIRKEVESLRRRFGVGVEMHYVLSPLSSRGLRQASRALMRHVATLGGGRVLVQARGEPAACAAVEAREKLPEIVVLYDARGDAAAEARLVARHSHSTKESTYWSRRAARLEQLQIRASKEADHILAVSRPLQEHLSGLSGVTRDKVTVIPCCVAVERFLCPSDSRDRIRRQLGLENRVVVVYSGSLAGYQLPHLTAELIEGVRSHLPEVHLLVLTRDLETASRSFSSLVAAGSCTIKSCRHEEVAHYLAAADVGILLRDDDPVNRVASPVKFAEYQVAGLPVIATPWIGDVSAYLQRTGHGLVVDLSQDPEELALAVARWLEGRPLPPRDDVRREAASRFTRRGYRDVYGELLEKLGFDHRSDVELGSMVHR